MRRKLFWSSFVRMCWTMRLMVIVFFFCVYGMMILVYFLFGDIKVLNIGFMNVVYCVMTLSTFRFLFTVFRFNRFVNFKLLFVFMNIFMWYIVWIFFIVNIRMFLMMIILLFLMWIFSSFRECVTKSYIGMFIDCRSINFCSIFIKYFVLIVFGWLKLYVFIFLCLYVVSGW